MFPDLGKYAFAVLTSYGISFLLFLGLIGVSLWQSRRAKQQLEHLEQTHMAKGEKRDV